MGKRKGQNIYENKKWKWRNTLIFSYKNWKLVEQKEKYVEKKNNKKNNSLNEFSNFFKWNNREWTIL